MWCSLQNIALKNGQLQQIVIVLKRKEDMALLVVYFTKESQRVGSF